MAKKRYPWTEWFSVPRTILVRGVHYSISQSSMSQSIRNNACRLGVRVRLVDTGVEIVVDVLGRTEDGRVSHPYQATVTA